MNDFKLELFLSSDGKHTVHLETDTKEQRDEGIPYAKALYKKIIEEFGTKQSLNKSTYNDDGVKGEGWCDIHKVQMKKYTKEGRSWYSHMVSEGVWCNGGKK